MMRQLLLNLCLLSLLKKCFSEGCLKELRENVDFPGSDVLQIFSPDELHCQQACSQHHSCQFFTFIRPDWTRDSRQFYCYLKHTSSGSPSQITDLEGVTSGYSLKNCKETSDLCLASVYHDVDFTGADYTTLFTADFEECQRACTSHLRCQFFSWLNDDFARPQYKYKCHLKYSWSVSKPPVVKTLSGVVSGFSQKFLLINNSQSGGLKEKCKDQILTDTDFPGHDFEQTPAVSAEHCQFLCSAHPKCTYFSYEKNTKTCFLKNSKDEKPEQRKEGMYSGMPSLFCEPSRDWMSVRYVDTDFPGFDMRYAYLDDPESCEALCTTDPHCQFYTYVFTSFYKPDFRKRCYLKRVITMPVPPKVVAMTGVVSGFSLKDCSNPILQRAGQECLKELRENVDFPGSDVLQIFSPDELHCQQACSQHHSCQFFTFIRPDWTRDSRQFYCYLKHTSSGSPSQITDLEGVTSGYSLKNCKETSGACLSSVYQDIDFTGADYNSLFTADYEECQRACTSDPHCQFFSWLNDDFPRPLYKYKCHLKYSWSVSKPPVVKTLSGVVSGFSQKFNNSYQSDGQKEKCKDQILTDTDFPGHDFEQTPAVSAEHCQFLCSAHPKCTYFSYEKNTKTCFLKNSKDEKPEQRKEGMYSGMPSRFCEPSRDWMSVRYEDTDFPGTDIRYVYLDDPESCEALCTTDPHCQFYTYVYTSFHKSDFRKRCYLKRVITMPVPPKVVAMTGVVSGFSLTDCNIA